MSFIGKTGPVPKPVRRVKPPKLSPEQKKANREKLRDYGIMCGENAKKKMKTVWKWFSLYIRLRGCNTGSLGFGSCITCCKTQHFKCMDAGHYVRQKNHKATVYEEKNVHLQCKDCNKWLNGNEDSHAKYIDETYGEGTAAALVEQGKEKWKQPPLIEVEKMIAEYRQKAKDEAFRVGVNI